MELPTLEDVYDCMRYADRYDRDDLDCECQSLCGWAFDVGMTLFKGCAAFEKGYEEGFAAGYEDCLDIYDPK